MYESLCVQSHNIYVMQLRSGEDPELRNTLRMPPAEKARLLNDLIIPQPKGDGGVRAIRSSPG